NVQQVLTAKQSIVAGAPLIDVLGTFENPIKYRGRASAAWSRGPLTVATFANYTGSYLNTAFAPNAKIDAQVTIDLTARYRFDGEGGLLNGLQASVSAQNLFDKEPPVVLNGIYAYDGQQASAIGRFIRFELTKAF